MQTRTIHTLLLLLATTSLLTACGGHSGSTVSALPSQADQPDWVETHPLSPPATLAGCLPLTPGTVFTATDGNTHRIIREIFNGIDAVAIIRIDPAGQRDSADYFRDDFSRPLGSIEYDDLGLPSEEIASSGEASGLADMQPGQTVIQDVQVVKEEFSQNGELRSRDIETVSGSVRFDGFVDLELAGQRFANSCKLTLQDDLREQAYSHVWITRGFGVVREDTYDEAGNLDPEDSHVITAVIVWPL